MKFRIEFSKEALKDVLDIIEWYEKHVVGLGDEFYISLQNALKLIRKNPVLFPVKFKNIRKAVTKRFPYLIFYIVEPSGKVVIIAILHMKRGSTALSRRVKE